jgi:hypothetical protein
LLRYFDFDFTFKVEVKNKTTVHYLKEEELTMVTLIVYGIPPDFAKDNLLKFCNDLCGVIQRTFYEIERSGVCAFFPPERLKDGLGEEIVIFVEGLYLRKKGAEDLRNMLAEHLCILTKQFFPSTAVDVHVRAFDPDNGFHSLSAKRILLCGNA